MQRAWLGLVAVVLACDPGQPPGKKTQEGTTTLAAEAAPAADRVAVLRGVPDRARDPAVLALTVGGETICSGVVISPRLLLTARHCLRRGVFGCPADGPQVAEAIDPQEIVAMLGEDATTGRNVARGLEIIEPDTDVFCAADIAVLALDNEVGGVKPLPVRARGPAVGEKLRSVGFAGNDKILRERVDVRSVSGVEFSLVEATCLGGAGGPAIDEDTGEVVGVVARDGDCGSARNVYTRADVFAGMVETAFARISAIVFEEAVAKGATSVTLKPAKRGTKARPPTDFAGPCAAGADCGTGICIDDGSGSGSQPGYCTLLCGAGERCAPHYRCDGIAGLAEGERACLDTR